VHSMARSDHCRSRFDAQMSAAFFKRRLDGPTMHEGRDDHFCAKRLIGAEQGLDRAFARRITSQHESRMGNGGWPMRYHRAVPLHHSTRRRP
jgi:hypothetical protein